MLFAQVAPIIPFFASFYFYIKYVVDKNNLLFVYCKKYESGGQIRRSTRYLLIQNLYIYLFTTVAFFALKFGDMGSFYKYAGFLIIAGWSVLLYYVLTSDYFASKAKDAATEFSRGGEAANAGEKLSEEKNKRIENDNMQMLLTAYSTPNYKV